MNNLYVLQYGPDNCGCPHYLSQRFDPEEWEWNGFEPDPFEIQVTKTYTSQITDREIKSINFDFYGTDSRYASKEFLELCEHLRVHFRSIPIDISLWDGSRPSKTYSVFLPADHLSILDTNASSYELDIVKETGETMMNHNFPQVPVYSKIEKFVPKAIEVPHLFQCLEIFSLVCTDTFRREAVDRGLRGLSFIPLDENYKYDPWAGW